MGIFLDFYGTIVENEGDVVDRIVSKIVDDHPEQSGSELAHRWGQTFSSLLVDSYGGSFREHRDLAIESLGIVLRQVGSDLDPAELSAERFAGWRTPIVRPGAAEFIAECPLPLCIVSNIDRLDLEAAIRHTGLSVSAVVTSQDARSYKPRREMFDMALEYLGLSRAEVLHVG